MRTLGSHRVLSTESSHAPSPDDDLVIGMPAMDPFAPVEPSSQGAPASACPRCHQPLLLARAAYDDTGTLVCQRCIASATVARADRTIARRDPTTDRNLWFAAIASFVCGIGTFGASLVGKAYFAIVFGLFVGVANLLDLKRHPEVRERLGFRLYPIVALSAIGLLFSLGAVGVVVLTLAGR